MDDPTPVIVTRRVCVCCHPEPQKPPRSAHTTPEAITEHSGAPSIPVENLRSRYGAGGCTEGASLLLISAPPALVPWSRPHDRSIHVGLLPRLESTFRLSQGVSGHDAMKRKTKRAGRTGVPQMLTGCTLPLDLPRPPPCGWSQAFMATPRTVGRMPSHRDRPALPSC